MEKKLGNHLRQVCPSRSRGHLRDRKEGGPPPPQKKPEKMENIFDFRDPFFGTKFWFENRNHQNRRVHLKKRCFGTKNWCHWDLFFGPNSSPKTVTKKTFSGQLFSQIPGLLFPAVGAVPVGGGLGTKMRNRLVKPAPRDPTPTHHFWVKNLVGQICKNIVCFPFKSPLGKSMSEA